MEQMASDSPHSSSNLEAEKHPLGESSGFWAVHFHLGVSGCLDTPSVQGIWLGSVTFLCSGSACALKHAQSTFVRKDSQAADSVCLVGHGMHAVQPSKGALSDHYPPFLPGMEGIEALL